MKIKFTFLVTILFISAVNAQIYTPSNTIQGTTGNDNVGIGTSNPNSKFVVMDNGYGISLHPATGSAGLGFNRNVTDGATYNSSVSA